MARQVQASHGIVCRMSGREDGYFGWPSVVRLEDGTLVVGASGFRKHHVDPWGKTVIWFSKDEGTSFSGPAVIHDSPLDDRDVGLVALGGDDLLASWFTLDVSIFLDQMKREKSAEAFAEIERTLKAYTPDVVGKARGSWTMVSRDGGKSWDQPVRCPVSTPHGPIRLKDGRLLYLGKQFHEDMDRPFGQLAVAVSQDMGQSWAEIATVSIPDGYSIDQFHEPHVLELKDGTLLGTIRYHYPEGEGGNMDVFQTVSTDEGLSWSEPFNLRVQGSPPHLLRHSCAAIVMSYGYRHPGYGQRARISYDEGKTWGEELVLRDDGEDGDLGYPCSVELENGDIFTVYYQKYGQDEQASILWTRWSLKG